MTITSLKTESIQDFLEIHYILDLNYHYLKLQKLILIKIQNKNKIF